MVTLQTDDLSIMRRKLYMNVRKWDLRKMVTTDRVVL